MTDYRVVINMQVSGDFSAFEAKHRAIVALAKAYGLPAVVLDTARPAQHIKQILAAPGPQIIVVELDRNQAFEPKLSSKRLPDGRMVTAPLEDMAPFLERDEFAKHMIVPPSE